MSTKDLVISKIQRALNLSTKREAEIVLNDVISAVEETLLENLENNLFSLKLNGLGKFTVRHRAGIERKIPFTGQVIKTLDARKVKFVSLGALRSKEKVPNTKS
jgi:nucleoid DNA-binding protein